MASSKKKGPVEKIALQCTECKRKNYSSVHRVQAQELYNREEPPQYA